MEETPVAVTVDISKLSRRPALYKVPMHVRRDKKHLYEPEVVPVGPYHLQGHPHSQLMEPLKDELQDLVCNDADRKSLLLSKIRERIDEIRHFYMGADGYDDKELAEMMLRDACLLICYLQGGDVSTLVSQRMGMSGMLFMFRDMRMLENQIPFWLISLIHPHPQSLLCDYMNVIVFGDNSKTSHIPWGNNEEGKEPFVLGGYTRITQLPWENGTGEEPLHLIDASRRTLLSLAENQENSSCFWRFIKIYNNRKADKESSRIVWRIMNSPFRSVTDLRAKGIHFQRSSNCLTDIKFFSFAFYGELHLPSFYVSNNTNVYFSNIIAFEMSPEMHTNYAVTTYFNFMKALINDAGDVKVLREKGILYSRLASDEEVVELFKSIDTHGFSNIDLFSDVKMRIEEHCNSKARTWMADLLNTKFQSPWTVIALVAATFLLCLTFLQTYFTINPRD